MKTQENFKINKNKTPALDHTLILVTDGKFHHVNHGEVF